MWGKGFSRRAKLVSEITKVTLDAQIGRHKRERPPPPLRPVSQTLDLNKEQSGIGRPN